MNVRNHYIFLNIEDEKYLTQTFSLSLSLLKLNHFLMKWKRVENELKIVQKRVENYFVLGVV